MATDSPENEIQSAIYTALSGSSALLTLLGGSGRISDTMQDNQAPPYIVIDDMRFRDWGSHTFDGFQGEIDLLIVTQGMGKKDNQTIKQKVYELLHNIDLGIGAHNTVNFRVSSYDLTIEPDNRTYVGTLQVEFILSGNET